MKQTFIMTASSKGGVGKSTAALGIARALAARGNKVLLCDLDFGNACLDILTGCEDSVIYTVLDVARLSSEPSAAVISVPGADRLFLMPAPTSGTVAVPDTCGDGEVSPEGMALAVRKAAESIEADFVIVDTGAGVSSGAKSAALLCSDGLCAVIASHNPTSLRAAENTAMRISGDGVGCVKLIINSFDADAIFKNKKRMGLLEMIDKSRIPLLGAVPYDYSLILSQEGTGAPTGDSGRAFSNIAARICGEDVPLFDGIKKIRKNRKKLFI